MFVDSLLEYIGPFNLIHYWVWIVKRIWKCSAISFKHVCLWCLFFDPHLNHPPIKYRGPIKWQKTPVYLKMSMTVSRATRNHLMMVAIILTITSMVPTPCLKQSVDRSVGGGCGNASVEAALRIAPWIHGTKSAPHRSKFPHISDACLHLGGFLHVTFILVLSIIILRECIPKISNELGVCYDEIWPKCK